MIEALRARAGAAEREAVGLLGSARRSLRLARLLEGRARQWGAVFRREGLKAAANGWRGGTAAAPFVPAETAAALDRARSKLARAERAAREGTRAP